MGNLTTKKRSLFISFLKEEFYSLCKKNSDKRRNVILGYIHQIFNYAENPDAVREILELSNKFKLDFYGLLRKHYSFRYDEFVNHCLISSPSFFIIVTDFGATNTCCPLECYNYLAQTYKWCREESDKMFSIMVDEADRIMLGPEKEYNCRPYQLLGLYVLSIYEKNYPASAYENALQVLWSSIPDSLLTKKEFTNSFGELDTRYVQRIMPAWHWYCKLVRDLESPDKCPRSLKHICRSTIRRSLKDNFQLPCGVRELNIPKPLEEYLLLKNFSSMN